MANKPGSSDETDGLNDTELAVLTASHHRGRISFSALGQLLPDTDVLQIAVERLIKDGYLNGLDDAFRVTQAGRQLLDEVLEGIQCQIAPEDPAYERRFRTRQPTLPFEANTVWEEAICVNFRVQPDALRPLVSDLFELDLYGGWAWISLTASRLKDFGMGQLPRMLRKNFYQATYRAHVTFTDFRNRRTRGCFFVRSETNSPIMSLTANMLPEFKAHHCSTNPILMARKDENLLLSVDSGDDPAGKVVLVLDAERPLAEMPETSVFESTSDAYDFIVDFYDAFSFDPDTDEVFILGIDRGDWDIQILQPVDHYFGYTESGPLSPATAELDSVFYFRNTPYRWLPLLKERTRRKSD